MTIFEKITKGESRIIEFKEAIPASKNFSKTIVSFSNGSGGELLLGVKDNGVYVRIGATNKKADRSMLQQLEREQSNITFDALTNFDFRDPLDWKFLSWHCVKL